MDTISNNEKKLIIILFISMVMAAYLIFRFKDNDRNLAFLKEQTIAAEESNSIVGPKPEKGSVIDLTDQLENITNQIIQERSTGSNQLVDVNDNEQLANFRYQITLLSEKNNLTLRRLKKEEIETKGLKNINRPSFSIEMSGTFFDVYAFMKGIDQLNYSVGIVSYDIARDAGPDVWVDLVTIKLKLVI